MSQESRGNVPNFGRNFDICPNPTSGSDCTQAVHRRFRREGGDLSGYRIRKFNCNDSQKITRSKKYTFSLQALPLKALFLWGTIKSVINSEEACDEIPTCWDIQTIQTDSQCLSLSIKIQRRKIFWHYAQVNWYQCLSIIQGLLCTYAKIPMTIFKDIHRLNPYY